MPLQRFRKILDKCLKHRTFLQVGMLVSHPAAPCGVMPKRLVRSQSVRMLSEVSTAAKGPLHHAEVESEGPATRAPQEGGI